jgi:hypothetical protein
MPIINPKRANISPNLLPDIPNFSQENFKNIPDELVLSPSNRLLPANFKKPKVP